MISPQSSPHHAAPLRGRYGRLALKELRETLRDRRTLITLLLMPLLVYPLLGVILQKALLSSLTPPDEIEYSIAFCSPEDAQRFDRLYSAGDSALPEEVPRPRLVPYTPEEPHPDCDPEDIIAKGWADLVVQFRNKKSPTAPNNSFPDALPEIELFYLADSPHSQAVVLAVEKRLQLVVAEETLTRNRNGQPVRRPVASRLMLNPVTPPEGDAPKFSLATFVPLMLILMTVTGAVYPAIDLTAGERERGTLEVLVAAPVPRMQLLGAKFIAVLTVAMLTAIVNLVAMLITLYASGLESLIFGERGMSWMVMAQILALLSLFAAFFSAVLLALTSFARSFKEAQAYLIPLMLVSLAPGIFSLTPGLKMNGLLAVVPLVNIVLLGRDLLEGQMVPLLFAGAVVSTILYAVLALSVAARVFGSDAILYGSQGNLKDLLHRPESPRDVPTLTQVTFALAVLFPGFVILGSLPGRFADLPMVNRLAMSSLITILLFAVWPLVMVWRNAVRFRSAFRVAVPSPWFFGVAVLWGLSLWIWAYELEILTLSPSRHDVLRDVFEAIKRDLDQIPFAWRLVTLALVPAVCEEWFFRGYLMSGLRAKRSNLEAVLISAGLFGLFHVVVRDMLFFERFLPSTFMGLMLGWLAVRSGSVWPGMLLHVLHNGLLISIEAHQEKLMAWGIGLQSQQHFPPLWLAGSGLAVGLGVIILLMFSSNSKTKEEQQPASPQAKNS